MRNCRMNIDHLRKIALNFVLGCLKLICPTIGCFCLTALELFSEYNLIRFKCLYKPNPNVYSIIFFPYIVIKYPLFRTCM